MVENNEKVAETLKNLIPSKDTNSSLIVANNDLGITESTEELAFQPR